MLQPIRTCEGQWHICVLPPHLQYYIKKTDFFFATLSSWTAAHVSVFIYRRNFKPLPIFLHSNNFAFKCVILCPTVLVLSYSHSTSHTNREKIFIIVNICCVYFTSIPFFLLLLNLLSHWRSCRMLKFYWWWLLCTVLPICFVP